MVTIQTSLWKGITADLGLDIYNRFEPTKNRELENLYYEMCKKFSHTLTDSQRKAFKKLCNMSNAIFSDNQDKGIALGIYIAAELQKLLSRPDESLREASDSGPHVSEMFESDIQTLNEYFDEYGKRGGVFND